MANTEIEVIQDIYDENDRLRLKQIKNWTAKEYSV
jgi:hypothetical protein